MKESRFIELLNLYVDQQLSPTEAAELDAEIEKNAARRQMYQQYCRIQKGCTVLFEKERTQAPVHPRLAAALAAADRKMNEPRRKVVAWPTFISVGTLAAAACFAVMFAINRAPSETSSPGAGNVAVNSEAVVPAPVSTLPAQPVSVARTENNQGSSQSRPEFYSVLATRSADDSAVPFSPALSESREIKSWMENVELMPVANLAEQRLTLQASQTAAPESGVLRSRKPVNGDAAEMSAFQFQR